MTCLEEEKLLLSFLTAMRRVDFEEETRPFTGFLLAKDAPCKEDNDVRKIWQKITIFIQFEVSKPKLFFNPKSLMIP